MKLRIGLSCGRVQPAIPDQSGGGPGQKLKITARPSGSLEIINTGEFTLLSRDRSPSQPAGRKILAGDPPTSSNHGDFTANSANGAVVKRVIRDRW